MKHTTHLILLAAGVSKRMGSRDKLLVRIGGLTILERAVSSAVRANIGSVLVVTGPDSYDAILDRFPVRRTVNRDFAQGMAASIRAGVEACGSAALAYGILPADMPFVQSETIASVASHAADGCIVVPVHKEKNGHPVFFSSVYRSELLALEGDVGAKSVIERHRENVIRVETDDAGVLQDVDTLADIESDL